MEMHVALIAWLRRIPHFSVDLSRLIEVTEGGIIRGPRTIPLSIG